MGSVGYTVPKPPVSSVRRSDALFIVYTARYQNLLPEGPTGEITHTECQPYEVTWCGDGQTDSNDGEQCDLGAQNGQTGSACSATCQPVVVTPPPVCGSTV